MKKVVIVGASSGIGLAAAEAFARGGISVGLAARNVEPLRALQAKFPGRVFFSKIDVSTPEAPRQLDDLIRRLGGMDLYFHVAGIGYRNPDLDPEKEVAIFETNTVGVVRCVSAAWQYFRHRGLSGRIAVISSVAGTKGIADLSAYSASKAAVSTWLDALRQLSNHLDAGISITDIRPGWIRTPLVLPDVKYPLEMSVEEVLPQILRAILHRKPVAIIDWRWNLLVGLWRLIPGFIWRNSYISMPLKEK